MLDMKRVPMEGEKAINDTLMKGENDEDGIYYFMTLPYGIDGNTNSIQCGNIKVSIERTRHGVNVKLTPYDGVVHAWQAECVAEAQLSHVNAREAIDIERAKKFNQGSDSGGESS